MRIVLVLAFSFFFVSCTNNIVYEQLHVFDESGVWKNANPLKHTFTVPDTESKYDLILDLGHNTAYPFENLYLRIKTEFPDQSMVYDTLSIEMINNQGQWVGACSGEECDLKVVLQQQVKFKDAGEHSITFEQFTRNEQLKAMRSLRFSLLKSS